MAGGWDRGGRSGNRQKLGGHSSPRNAAAAFLTEVKAEPLPRVCPGPAAHPARWGEPHGAELHEGMWFSPFVSFGTLQQYGFVALQLPWCLLIPEGAAFGLLLAARALLSTCSSPFPRLPLHWAHAPLSSSDTSCCKNPVLSNYLGKQITENRVFQFGSPQIFFLQPPSITAVQGQPFCWRGGWAWSIRQKLRP